MTEQQNNQTITIEELRNVAKKSDLNTVEEKVKKCYSSEKYEEFQDAVEKILGRYLKGSVGWVVFIWLITLIGSMFIQKIFAVF